MKTQSCPEAFRKSLFLTWAALAAGAASGFAQSPQEPAPPIPAYLSGYEALYAVSPRQAALKWFADAKYGLKIQYCLASVLNQGTEGYEALPYTLRGLKPPPPHQADDNAQATQWGRDADRYLFERFTASEFDAAKIADLAVATGMKYINFPTAQHGGMLMWNSALSDFNSFQSPARRDFLAEMAAVCARRRLGLFLYVPPDTSRTDGEFFQHNQHMLTEVLTHYGPIAGIWFDGINAFHKRRENYRRVQELFALVRRLQPQCLVSWKTSPDGTDFLAPEHAVGNLHFQYPALPVEVCTTMQKCRRRDLVTDETGWINNDATTHLSADAVIMMIRELQLAQASDVLISIGLRGDGSIHPDDEKALRAAGAYMRENWAGKRTLTDAAPGSAPRKKFPIGPDLSLTVTKLIK